MINLLHLSDLHFGYERDATAARQRALALDELVEVLEGLKAEWRPRILVISGDLSWQGKPAGYPLLGQWLTEKVFPATGLTCADCVFCPGNHDLDRNAAISLLDRTASAEKADRVLRPENLAEGFARPFAALVKFAGEFGVRAPVLNGLPNYLAGVVELHGIHFVCANSAWFCRDSKSDRGELWIGLPQLESMPLMRPADYDTAPITVAVVHHPQDWLTYHESSAPENRPNTYRYLADRSHAILSGHTHGAVERATRCYDRARLFLGGASYDNLAYRNNFSILQIDPRGRTITRRPWEFDPRDHAWGEKPREEYSLRIERAGRRAADPSLYLAWLRTTTQSIDLNKLKVAPGKTPPPEIDVLYIRLMTAARSGEGVMERGGPVPLEEALENRLLVIEGEPGAGKTTFLRWLAWMLCRPAGPPPDLPVRDRCPLFLRISELDQHVCKTLERGKAGDPTVPADSRWIAHFLASQGWNLDEEFFRDRLAHPETVLLLDGLDEAASPQRRHDIVQTIQKAAAQFACRIVVTTRPGEHEGKSTLTGFAPPVKIQDLDDPGIDAFLLRWCQWLKHGDETAAREYYSELRPAVAVPGIRRMARNPLMLTALAALHLRRCRLPEQRAELYKEILDWLAEQAADRHREYTKDERIERFGHLALGMQEWKGGHKVQIGLDAAAGLITPPKQPLDGARRFLEQAQTDSGIVTLRGGEIAFWHRSFQEYLAARTLSNMSDAVLQKRACKFLYSPEGREVLPLLAGCLSRDRLDLVMADMIAAALRHKTLAKRAHAVGVVGNMLADVNPLKYELPGAAGKQYAELRDAVMAIFQKGKARNIGLKTRVAAAEALDSASQSRLCTPRDDRYWVEIPGGTLRTGDKKVYNSLPSGRVKIPGFRIGRFPVTVWEYARYVDETNAYPPEDWSKQSEFPSRPITSVSWYDAQAYCEWAGCQLPTEQQWEFAARGTEGRVYPWGGENEQPDEHRANFKSMVGAPTPVGMFPDGETPEGVADMAGNVWEWTRSDYDNDTKCVRGVSFVDVGAERMRAAHRLWFGPGFRDGSIGFRCVPE